MTTKKYLCLQRSQPDSGTRQPPTPEQMKERYARFEAWMKQFQGNIVDLGGRLGDGKLVTSLSPTDGPYAEASEDIGGFMILQAASLEEAIRVARACPGVVGPGSGVEVVEIKTG